MADTSQAISRMGRRMVKKAALLTRPTPAVISLARPESAKSASLPKDAPFPAQRFDTREA
jgi:hypothetical protein